MMDNEEMACNIGKLIQSRQLVGHPSETCLEPGNQMTKLRL